MDTEERALLNKNKYEYLIIPEGIIIGIIAGVIVSLYRYLLAVIFDFSVSCYSKVDSVFKAVVMFAVFIVLGAAVGLMVKREPLISGSGIPQVEGVLLGKMRFNWLRALVLKFLGGLICLGAGMSLGREGPSVQIGAATGLGISRFRIIKGNKTRERYLLTFGAAAGLAAAFNAPFAGALFVMEELHKSFNKYVFIGGTLTGITADMVSKKVFGTSPVFTFGEVGRIPYSAMYYVIILGVALGLIAVLFNKCIIFGANNYGKLFKIPDFLMPVPAFILTGIIALTLPQLLGGGHSLIDALPEANYGIGMLIALLVVKFLFTEFCFASKAPGGIFLPLLTIGGLCGAVCTSIFVKYMGASPGSMSFFIAVSLAGFFGAVTKAPVTGIILVCEMTGSFSQFLFLSVVTIVSFMVTEIFGCGPIYEMILHNTLRKQKGEEEYKGKRVVVEIPVQMTSAVVHKTVGELNLPESLLITSINRDGEVIVPKNDVIIKSGDELVLLLYEKDLLLADEYFSKDRAQ
ncbi:MAG: ClC family H(+)/Cl(-) exchange transporter [Clostridiales bacterium]|nr:ClC family H(+)/Cl(-) exchange transporter [Clostridiales bacterium]